MVEKTCSKCGLKKKVTLDGCEIESWKICFQYYELCRSCKHKLNKVVYKWMEEE